MLNSTVIIGALASNFLAVTDLNSALCIVIIYCAWDHFEQRSIPNHEVNSQPNSNEQWTCTHRTTQAYIIHSFFYVTDHCSKDLVRMTDATVTSTVGCCLPSTVDVVLDLLVPNLTPAPRLLDDF